MQRIIKCLYRNSDYEARLNLSEVWKEKLEVPGFTRAAGDLEKRSLVAPNGATLIFGGNDMRICRGNDLEVSLCHHGKEYEKIALGSLFTSQDLVIIICKNRLHYFAPLCRSHMEIVRFLAQVDNMLTSLGNQKNISDYESLAMWLYEHNPRKMLELF